MASHKFYNAALALMLLLTGTKSFAPTSMCLRSRENLSRSNLHQLFVSSIQDTSAAPSRRDFIVNGRNALLLSSISVISGSPSVAHAKGEVPVGSLPDRPVAILGGGGKTGKEVAAALAREGMYGVAMSRTGKPPVLPGYTKDFVQPYPGPVDVCDSDGLVKAMHTIHASAIVYCASASSKGGNAFQVDDAGVANAATAAKELGVRFVLVSALGVDRPKSKGYQMTNSLGGNYDGIMDAKRQGEEKVRTILAKSKNYMIVRPGPLLGVKSKEGVVSLEINQGDIIGGGISRDELAGVVVGALLCKKQGSTVEVYRTKTRQKIQPEFENMSGNEYASGTYVGLFDNVKID